MTIELGFKAFDPHELLCHFVAVDAALYDGRVSLRDITFEADGEVDGAALQASCGSATLSPLPYRILLVASRQPLFWLVARRGTSEEALDGAKIAGYPPFAPPARFLDTVIGAAGARIEPARDDVARVGLLVAGEVAAALVSAAMPLPRLARLGLEPVFCIGDRITLPTTGLASLLVDDRVKRVVTAHREALALVHAEPQRVVRILKRYFAFDAEEADWFAQIALTHFSLDGTPPPDVCGLYAENLEKR